MMVLEVAVLAPVTQCYSYTLPDDLLSAREVIGDVRLVGRRVLVPFGARRVIGYVVAALETQKPELELKHISAFLDDDPLFHQNIVALFTWVASYYHHPLGNVIKTALPAGLSSGQERRITLHPRMRPSDLADQPEDIRALEWLNKVFTKGALSAVESKKILALRPNGKIVKRLIAEETLTIETGLKKDRVGKKHELCYRVSEHLEKAAPLPQGDTVDATNLFHTRPLGKAEQKTILILKKIAKSNGSRDVPRKELLHHYPYGAKVIERLIEEGLVEPIHTRVYRSPFGNLLPYYARPHTYTEEQISVLKEIEAAVIASDYCPFLLYGVTGCGKTEVYLAAAEKTLEMGRSVLVLVPEIALATQLEAHFVSRFNDRIALLHSGLSAGERYDEWSRIYSGAARIVIGARSAVFSPLPDLGLVIVDEEHDASFKQDDGLRYNGRDVAIVRAKQQGAVVILGSATPAVTSYHHACTGKYRLLKMTRRVGDKDLPEVTLLDLRKREKTDKKGLFHRLLREALKETYEAGKQSILLLNRRGFSTSVICRECGVMVECRHCKVTMNLHKGKRLLLCHYCGFELPENITCQSCGAEGLHPIGFGTERVVEAVEELVPEARIARLDSDICSDRRRFLAILQAVREQEVDILVGTQMIAKGLHFPGVTLVGIVCADSGLSFPDFRATEKTYQLIAQVTGRAGRGEWPGRVFIQTMQPEHYAIALAAHHHYEQLAARELHIRRAAMFPPYVRLVSILVEHREEMRARKIIAEIAGSARSWLRRNSSVEVMVLGPAPAPIEKLKDRYRWQLLLKTAHIEAVHRLIHYLEMKFQQKDQERIIIDIDPENML